MKRPWQERRFFLVQRLRPAIFGDGTYLANPFGYGLLGAFELDYMGAAEYEWGAIPESYKRLQENKGAAGRTLINGKQIEYIYIEADGDPASDLYKWVMDGCPAKETARFYERVMDQENVWMKANRVSLFWSLEDDVIFGFAEDGNIEKLFDSLNSPSGKVVFRG